MTETVEEQTKPHLPGELVSSALFLLKRLGMSAKEQSMEAYDEAGLHPYHHAILALLDELEGDGLVERRRDTVDRRRQTVTITPAGRKTLERLRGLSAEMEDEFLAPLSASERKELHGLLLRVASQHLPNCPYKA